MTAKRRVKKAAKVSGKRKARRPAPSEALERPKESSRSGADVAALHERESRLTAILDTATDAIITIDKRGVIESVNPATERMFGYAAEELIGQNVKMLMPSPYFEEHDRYIADYLQTGVKQIIGIGREVVALHKDGSEFPIDLAVSEVDHLKMFTGIVRDISGRKLLEREVVEIAMLEQQRLGADLHDECGQELTALGLLASSLVQSLNEHSPADVEVAGKIVVGLRRLLHYIHNIAQGLARAKIDPAELSTALAELTTRLSETSGVRCSFDADGVVDIKGSIAATHLYHIAQEACTNALKHSQARNVRVRLEPRAGALILQVQDDGVGIPKDAREGLGMHIMRNRARVMGAALTIEPAKRRGTVVTCTLHKERRHVPQ